MLRRTLLAGLAGLGLLWACNQHEPHPPSLSDTGNGPVGSAGGSSGTRADGGLTDSGTGLDAGECTDLETPTTIIDENGVSDDAPPGLGGDLTTINATYDLQTVSKYVGATGLGGPNGITYREIIRITGGNLLERNRIVQQNNGPEQIVNASYLLQAQSTTTLSLTQQCPTQGGTEAYAFTLQDGRLTLTSVFGESFTYVARP